MRFERSRSVRRGFERSTSVRTLLAGDPRAETGQNVEFFVWLEEEFLISPGNRGKCRTEGRLSGFRS